MLYSRVQHTILEPGTLAEGAEREGFRLMSPNHFDDLQQVFATIGWPTNAPVLNPMLPVDTGAPSAAAAELSRRFDSAPGIPALFRPTRGFAPRGHKSGHKT
jgi:hypothetical protein